MRQGLTWLTGLALGTNGVWMLIRPEIWYYAIPGVTGTGPLNLHFIRDIGCAYLGAAAGLLWMASRPREFWPAALAGGAFPYLARFRSSVGRCCWTGVLTTASPRPARGGPAGVSCLGTGVVR